MTDPTITKIYGNKVRVRACGLCRSEGKLLMVRHSELHPHGFWAPPGGGIDFGLSIEETLKKEFQEETGLSIEVGIFAFGVEFINPPLHAIELFYPVAITAGQLKTGFDPEHNVIQHTEFLSDEQILAIPSDQLHGIFKYYRDSEGLKTLHGFYKI